MSKKISYARLQTSFFLKNVGDLGTVLPPMNKVLKGLSMRTGPEGLEVSMNENKSVRVASVIIPYANIVYMQVSEDSKE